MTTNRAAMILEALAIAGISMITTSTVRAQTTITPVLEYKCYEIASEQALNKPVTLTDQFQKEPVVVQESKYLCNPSMKTINGMTFGVTSIVVPPSTTTTTIVIPHLKCYKIVPSTTVQKTVNLTGADAGQFPNESNVLVTAAEYLCTTVTKTVVP